jgi:hypothetical protein
MTQLKKQISLLRQRMIDEMNMRKLSPKTQQSYLRAVERLANISSTHQSKQHLSNCASFKLHWSRKLFHRPFQCNVLYIRYLMHLATIFIKTRAYDM